MKTRSLAATGLAILLAVHCGCGVDQETLESLQSAVRAVSSAPPEPNIDSTPAIQNIAATEVQFTPPHPDRLDPFSFPETASVGERDDASLSTVSEVEILGFANVGTQHVLVRSGEKTRSLEVGEIIDGVRIVAINPPSVQLQMGTLIWTATMFDKEPSE